ncbi:class I SAM-dependent methyltransferase [Stigmatella sp. ncwal1]|uniref:Class I SAM-dependent methyltransferase n=1 Tax=Stigmatella ashevillensis TaxID=2995309 RepID=A0ABT5DJR7_9BACT|nr:class I SAM-dependent methyltransferase [Stigmatella ashevillena]MDC0712606.1 class I SAM-dependent methyltransferase [Stigmatella ashevillena]
MKAVPSLLAAPVVVLLVAGACAHAPSGEGHSSHEEKHAGHASAHSGGMPHRFEKAEEWEGRFEDPARDAWQKPDEVITALALPPDARVADLGSATGYFAVRLAKAVPQGRVFGVDIEPDMVRYLGERARKEGLAQLTPVLGEPMDPKLPEPVDLVLVVDTYHHIADRTAYFRKIQASLTPRGRVAIIDFRKDQPMGPPEAHKLAPEQVRQELETAGYRLVGEHGFLPNQYFLVFAPTPT